MGELVADTPQQPDVNVNEDEGEWASPDHPPSQNGSLDIRELETMHTQFRGLATIAHRIFDGPYRDDGASSVYSDSGSTLPPSYASETAET
jgi:hypothetical protein